MWTSLVTARGESDEASRALENDLRTGDRAPELFDSSILKMLTLSEWENQKANIVKDDMPCTLLLVDENFQEEGGLRYGGLQIIGDLLKAQPEKQIVCALLSNSYSISTIHADWKTLSEDHGFSRSRFVLIPKDSLTADQNRFLALIKLAVFNGRADKMKSAVNELYTAAMHEAQRRLMRSISMNLSK